MPPETFHAPVIADALVQDLGSSSALPRARTRAKEDTPTDGRGVDEKGGGECDRIRGARQETKGSRAEGSRSSKARVFELMTRRGRCWIARGTSPRVSSSLTDVFLP